MAEFNPYKLEEEKWTPKNVYEILPPNAVSWSDYEFGQGTDNVDGEAAKKSFIDGFVDFFKDLFGVAGQILGGALELGGKILGGFVNGVINLVGGIAKAIGSIFGGGSSESPNLPLFNPIKTNLEAAIQPHRDKINESWQKTEEILAEQEVLRGQMAESLDEMRDASSRAQEASERAGTAIEEAEAALAAAEEARETLEEYNTALTEQIRVEFNAAVGRADTAVEKADTLAGELADFKTQAATDVGNALSRAQAASDELAALAPQIDEAIDNASAASDKADQTLSEYTAWAAAQKIRIDSAVSEAEAATANVQALSPQVADAVDKSAEATNKVAALTPQVSDAVAQAGAAVTKADAVTSAYNTFKTEQQARIDTAVSKAEKATSDVSTLTPKVTDAVSKATKAASDVSTLTPKVDDAAAKAAKASTDVSALTPKVTAAQDKANKTANDLSTLTPKVTAAQSRADAAYTEAGKVRDEVTPKIDAAQTKGESALAVADKAVDWLKNPVEIGTSVIYVDPETKRPHYAAVLELVDDNPPGTSGPTYMSPASRSSYIAYGPYVPVDSKIKYTVSFWAKANVAGSILYGQLRTQEGRRVAPDGSPPVIGSVSVSNPPQPSNKNEDGEYVHNKAGNSYFIQALELPTEWTYYEHEIQFAEGVTAVSISTMYWNHNHGVATDQYISGLDIRPQIPTQASVDQAQNDAIRANSEILRQQGEINEAQRVANLAQKNFNDNQTKWNTASTNATQALADAAQAQKDINAEQTKFNNFQTQFNKDQTKWNAAVDRSIATQKDVNDNFKKWTDGATTAIEANTAALAIINSSKQGSNIIPVNPVSGRPWFAEVLEESTDHPPLTSGPTYMSPAAQTAVTTYGPYVEVDPKIRYTLSFWAKASKAGSVFYGQFRSQEGRTVTPTGGPISKGSVTVSNPPQPSNKDSDGKYVHNARENSYFVSKLELNTTWTYYETEIQFNEGITAVSILRMYWSHTDGIKADQYISGLSIRPQIPTQAQVDAAQNTAIEAHDLLFEKQDEWNAGVTAALETQETVNKNFKKWSDGAAEAIEANKNAIKALTKPEIGSSLIALDPDTREPHYMQWAGSPRTPSTAGLPFTKAVRNDSSVETRADAPGGQKVPVKLNSDLTYKWSVWIYSNKSNAEIRFLTTSDSIGLCVEKTTYQHTKKSSTSKWGIFVDGISTGWAKYEGTIKFLPGADNVHLYAIEWNKTSIPSTQLWFSQLDIVPDVPTQAQVDDAQNKAIESLNILAAKQDSWSEGAQKAIDANRDVATALARINGIQLGGRNLLKDSALNVSNNTYNISRAYFGDSVPEDGEEITISLKGTLGAGRDRFGFYNSGGSTYLTGAYAEDRDSNGVYKVVTKWKSNTLNTYLNIYAMPNSGTATSKIEWVKLERGNQASDWTPAPEDLPTQKQVDDAQTTAIRANTDALKALGKRVLGASLVPYKTPSDQEVEDYREGKLNYDPWADPEYFDAGYSIASNTTYGRYTRANASQGSKFYNATHVSVDSSIEYRIKFDAYAADEGSILVVAMQDQNGSTAVQSTSVRDAGTMGNTSYPIHYLTLKKGWSTYSGKIRFKPTTTAARFSTFYWNHSNGVSTTQCLTNLEIVPDIPSQAVVDELQDNAIRKNTGIGKENKAAIDALRDGLDAAIELETVDSMIGELQDALAEEERKRDELQAEVDALQTEMIPRTIVWESDRATLDDYISMPASNKVVALPGWTGQMVVTSVIRRGRGTSSEPTYYQTSIDRYSVPTGTSREWTIYSGASYEYISSMRVDYWVYRGRPRTLILKNAGPYITGSSFKSGTWSVVDYRTVGKTYGTGRIEWRADLRYADRGVTYRFKIQVNGTDIKTYEWKNIGPLTGLGSGKKTLRFEHEFNLPDDATVRILGYAYNSTAKQAQVSLLQGTLSYVQDTAREA